MRYIITATLPQINAMPRFYCSPPLTLNAPFDLPMEAAHHAARVLRLREGDPVEVFDGCGNACQGIITELSGKRVSIGNVQESRVARESPLPVILAQALLSSEKMDWVIQKATELGAHEIQPLATERSVAKLSAERAEKRLEHWRQVAISACEQCGRNVLPLIHPPLDMMLWLQQTRNRNESKFILLPQVATALSSQPKPQDNVVLLIGAEGGFSPAESESAILCGYTPIRLGARVLRTETAALAGITALQTLWGDFN
jgi:16S rRNA (uracil1498-N3)-methyltransferase